MVGKSVRKIRGSDISDAKTSNAGSGSSSAQNSTRADRDRRGFQQGKPTGRGQDPQLTAQRLHARGIANELHRVAHALLAMQQDDAIAQRRTVPLGLRPGRALALRAPSNATRIPASRGRNLRTARAPWHDCCASRRARDYNAPLPRSGPGRFADCLRRIGFWPDCRGRRRKRIQFQGALERLRGLRRPDRTRRAQRRVR